ncbi:MAG: nucleotidyltransferase domain-containing protein [Saprospiraceae bacterium]
MQELINDHLHRIALEHQVRILYACETGSRGWGFASPDSDYDVRFIYAYPLDHYLSINEPETTLGSIFEDGGEVLDFNAWELRKTLHHLRKSNATPFEWLQSPIIYQQEGRFREELWSLAPNFFDPRATVHHYLGICHNSIKTGISGEHINIKKYFYILRPLLAAKWAVEQQTIPPMEFRPLLTQIAANTALMKAIQQLWTDKEKAPEGQYIPLIPIIQEFIAAEMEHCRTAAAGLEKMPGSSAALDLFFRKTLLP